MEKVNALLTERLKKTDGPSKMAAMAKQSASGNLTSFSGVFSITDLSEHEKMHLQGILRHYATDIDSLNHDLENLIFITSEVKSINNQGALLHGERIKKAHEILIKYRDGAFTAWLIAAYGNRQTPYNLMQYYEFCCAMPKTLRLQIESMPRQVVYVLASRDGSIESKKTFVENYYGETKAELLTRIREAFPLAEKDLRRKNIADKVLIALKNIHNDLKKRNCRFSTSQKNAAVTLLEAINQQIKA